MSDFETRSSPVHEPCSVSRLLASVARTLVDCFPDEVWVEGTITSWRPYRWRTFVELSEIRPGTDHPSGRLTLVMHRRTAEVITRSAGLADGETPVRSDVAVGGRLSIGTRGSLELRAVAARPLVTPSRAHLDREQRRAKLTTSGRMDRQRALVLADALTRVGLVTPAAGEAARSDVLGQLPPGIAVVERRVGMEGPHAAGAIARALDTLALSAVELVLVVRGGGSAAELAPFDAEVVAAAIARVPVPVIVAVGHSTDHTLADEVAWRSLPTPTAAANWLRTRGRLRATERTVRAADERHHEAARTIEAARVAHADALTLYGRAIRLRRRLAAALVVTAVAAAATGAIMAVVLGR